MDASTPSSKLLALPLKLSKAAKEAILKAKPRMGFGEVTFNNEADGHGAEVTSVNQDGVTFLLVITVAIPKANVNVWKLVQTQALLGMLAECEASGVKLGRAMRR